ncbi:peptide deformylase [Rhodococcus maanshanensis]|uniref:Peptide deformylase n=1 Tax=Rhodococcus maanshanensis TaxID=183556 RepID=A0A1H7Q8J0_9NOCA|nr:peptide deformylase [Rhodococcus maanshanensis]SEL44186.1 peptide deformylase [Rhodococcus maanshanensis]
MSIQPVRLFGDPVLRTRADEVVDFDRELHKLVADLEDTMNDEGGAGIAAPQIGVSLRVFTYHCGGAAGHLINPTVRVIGDEVQTGVEGCLSIPGVRAECTRAMNAVATGFSKYGEPITIEGTGILARCFQHETDHLDGVLFLDRLDPEARKEAMRTIRRSDWFGAKEQAQAGPFGRAAVR